MSVKVFGPIETTGIRLAGAGVPVLVTWTTPPMAPKVVAKSLGGAAASRVKAAAKAKAPVTVKAAVRLGAKGAGM